MTVCLQGGGEFSVGCRPMDSALLERTTGRVVVTALAGSPGRDYATATANGVRHFQDLGADAIGAPDARQDPDGALAALSGAGLVVLPGGSPSRLRSALLDTGVGALLTALLANGASLCGSSAGAMVLGSSLLLPDGEGPRVADGLDAVPGVFVVPHWDGPDGRQAWLGAAHAGLQVLGLPEESGVLVEDGVFTAVGRHASRLVTEDSDLAPGQTWRIP